MKEGACMNRSMEALLNRKEKSIFILNQSTW